MTPAPIRGRRGSVRWKGTADFRRPLTSTWPGPDPQSRPRPATVVITKDDGGVIGT